MPASSSHTDMHTSAWHILESRLSLVGLLYINKVIVSWSHYNCYCPSSAMPLWSIEDWRARIGSCWCALGRTFNTRFTRCRGKSQRDLSTHQAATMVIMMILFIVANMGLYITRERHKNLICKFWYELYRFPVKVRIIVLS